MPCYECGSEEGTMASLCPACLARKRSARAARLENWRELSAPRRRGVMATPLRSGIFLGMLTLLCIGAALFVRWFPIYGSMPSLALDSKEGEQQVLSACRGRERCVVTFFAPWCPACEGALPFFNDMRSRFDQEGKVGSAAIVGMDKEQRLRVMAGKIFGQAYFDDKGDFVRALGVRGVPAWWVVDKEGTIVNRGTGFGISGGNKEQNFTYFVTRILKIED